MSFTGWPSSSASLKLDYLQQNWTTVLENDVIHVRWNHQVSGAAFTRDLQFRQAVEHRSFGSIQPLAVCAMRRNGLVWFRESARRRQLCLLSSTNKLVLGYKGMPEPESRRLVRCLCRTGKVAAADAMRSCAVGPSIQVPFYYSLSRRYMPKRRPSSQDRCWWFARDLSISIQNGGGPWERMLPFVSETGGRAVSWGSANAIWLMHCLLFFFQPAE